MQLNQLFFYILQRIQKISNRFDTEGKNLYKTATEATMRCIWNFELIQDQFSTRKIKCINIIRGFFLSILYMNINDGALGVEEPSCDKNRKNLPIPHKGRKGLNYVKSAKMKKKG